MLSGKFTREQEMARSLFFFVAPTSQLDAVDARIAPRQVIRLFPADFWDRDR